MSNQLFSEYLNHILEEKNDEALADIIVAVAFGWNKEDKPIEEENTELTALDILVAQANYSELTDTQLRTIANVYGVKDYKNLSRNGLLAALDNVSAIPNELDLPKAIIRDDIEVERFVIRRKSYFEPDAYGFPVYKTDKVKIPAWAEINNTNSYFTNSGENPIIENQYEKNEIGAFHGEKAPYRSFYSTTKSWPRHRWISQWKHYEAWMVAIHNNKGNVQVLETLFKKFVRASVKHDEAGDTYKWLWKKQINNIRIAFNKYLKVN